MSREPISRTGGLASGRLGPWSEVIEAVKIGNGLGEAPTLLVFVLTMAPAFNTAGLAFAWMEPLQDLASRFSTMPGQMWENLSSPARKALLEWSFQRKVRSEGSH